ncbi:MAG TPA: pyridoxal-phosphate dependent enzyme [Gemmatimonadales bacterium]|nr:pyridoxal-phosphate dependent enzyme [Gemmatimonadales bacterium]
MFQRARVFGLYPRKGVLRVGALGNPIAPIGLEQIEAARARLAGQVVRTPLLRLPGDAPATIYLKLENLQPIGSFKVRGAGNAMLAAGPERLLEGVYTASAGNMAQGVAWMASRLGIPAAAIVPDHAPQTKLRAIERLGARAVKVPFDDWWSVITGDRQPDLPGRFIHPVADPDVMAGNGTIGLEIMDDLPEVDAVLVPFGGGGLSCGIASAIRAKRPGVKVFACEVDTAAPLAASWAAGAPQPVSYHPSFVDGIGGKSVLPGMWPLARALLAGSLVVSLTQVAEAIRLLVERMRVVAEGAGAAGVAAALAGKAGTGQVVCVVSGGNIDADRLVRILQGQTPA